MPEVASFPRTLLVVFTVHLGLLASLVALNQCQSPTKPDQVHWLDGGSLGGNDAPADSSPQDA
ncbi:MAG: hypothetical protein WCI46_09605, partial [Verrucomicrobiota bacterium]